MLTSLLLVELQKFSIRWKGNSFNHSIPVKYTHTHTCLTALFPGLPGWAGTRKVKPIWILLKQESEWQWHQLGHMQVCTLLQTDNHASTPPLGFYRPDALPAAQPTASKHWRHSKVPQNNQSYSMGQKNEQELLGRVAGVAITCIMSQTASSAE